MISILKCHAGERLDETKDMASLRPWLAEAESRLWVNVVNPSVEEMEEIGRRFEFHPLTVEDCLHGGQRPKLEEYEGYLFMVLHTLPRGIEVSTDLPKLPEIFAYVTPRALVTVHREDLEAVIKLRERLRKEPALLTHPPGFLLHFLVDSVVDEFFPFLDRLEEDIDKLEDRVLVSARPPLLRRLFVHKRSLIRLRKSLSPLREVVHGLSRRDYPLLDPKTVLYFRDVYDHIIQASEMVDTCRDLIGTTVEAYLSATSNRMNDIIRQLTIIATIFLPLSVITGFFGMNFEQIPWKNPLIFFLTVLAILAVPVLMLIWFAREGWLKGESVVRDKRERQADSTRRGRG